MRLILGHSPDPDDAFMLYALLNKRIQFDYDIIEFIADIETLNRLAIHKRLDVTAISVHAYAYIADSYYLLRTGASMGLRYGPIVVGRTRNPELIAVPGAHTTAALLLRLAMPNVRIVEIPFDLLTKALIEGIVDAGVLIHEGQLTYTRLGLIKILDLGEWWYGQTKLPIPLGVNIVRSDLGIEFALKAKNAIRESIIYAFRHRDEALEHAVKYARGLERGETWRYILMYVNEYSIDMGQIGEKAIRKLLEWGADARLIPKAEPIFV